MAKQPLTTYGPVPTGSNGGSSSGILSVWVLQPTNTSPSDDGTIKYTEQWKGPYEVGKNILNHVGYRDTIDVLHTALGSNRVYRIDPPDPPLRNNIQGVWRLEGIEVDELEAGDHCMLNCRFYADYTTVDAESKLRHTEDNDTWSISWMSYTVTPFAFCSNVPHEDRILSPSNVIDDLTDEQWKLGACREHIETYRNNNPQVLVDGQKTGYVYTPDLRNVEERKRLAPAETEVFKKIALDRNATYHYPMITHTEVWTSDDCKTVFHETCGVGLDTILDELPDDCPYTFSDDWEWMKIGEDITQSKTKSKTGVQTATSVKYERKTVYAGYHGIDKNYYGSVLCPKQSDAGGHSEGDILNKRWQIEGI